VPRKQDTRRRKCFIWALQYIESGQTKEKSGDLFGFIFYNLLASFRETPTSKNVHEQSCRYSNVYRVVCKGWTRDFTHSSQILTLPSHIWHPVHTILGAVLSLFLCTRKICSLKTKIHNRHTVCKQTLVYKICVHGGIFAFCIDRVLSFASKTVKYLCLTCRLFVRKCRQHSSVFRLGERMWQKWRRWTVQ
jgi:hypothetical protein